MYFAPAAFTAPTTTTTPANSTVPVPTTPVSTNSFSTAPAVKQKLEKPCQYFKFEYGKFQPGGPLLLQLFKCAVALLYCVKL